MSAIDGWLEGFLEGGQVSLWLILLIGLALGLRHASDPDHLAAVTTLVASGDGRSKVGRAGLTGFSWGLGHGTILVVLGLPLVLFSRFLPEPVVRVAETLIGLIIVVLAAQLLLKWRRGHFHVHEHDHDQQGSHRHVHEHSGKSGSHSHAHAVGQRTPLSAYGVGLVHGIGGSAGVVLLLLSTIESTGTAIAALFLYAGGTAISMALLSTVFGFALASGPIARNFERVAPVLGAMALVFGLWYASGALGLVGYPF